MLKYIFKRILIFIPTLIIISLMIFGLSKMAPGDPVELRMAGGLAAGDSGLASDKLAGEKQYFEIARSLGMDLPTFYASLTSYSMPDTLYKVGRRFEKETLSSLVSQYGNWPKISKYYKSLKGLEISTFNVEKNTTTYESLRSIRETCNELYRESNHDVIISKLTEMEGIIAQEQTYEEVIYNQYDLAEDTIISKKQLLKPLEGEIAGLLSNYKNVYTETSKIKNYIPWINWYGFKNQYHRWLFGDKPWFGKSDDPTLTSYGFLRGDFGKSLSDGRPVWSVIKEGVGITVGLNIIVFLLIYGIGIPLGVLIAIKKDSLFDRFSTIGMFVLYSLPSFWIATMAIVFFTNSEYGMDWFPTFGLAEEGSSIGKHIWHIILPVFCMTYGSFAFLARQMRGGVLDVFNMDYIRTARAKGLSERKVIWKHTFRNSMIPLITMFASLLPAMIGGSLIIEIIFSIPGMGAIAFGSLVSRDWPILFTVVMFASILTLVGILLSDILYSVVDPRISFTKKS